MVGGRWHDDQTSTAAYAALAEEHYRSIYRLCFWLADGSHDAEDLCQEVFVRALRKFGQLRDRSKARYWLTQITLNTVRTARRRTKRQAVRHETDGLDHYPQARHAAPEDQLAAQERNAEVYRAVHALPGDNRAVVVLRVMQGLTGTEVAGLLGLSQASVSRRLHEGMDMLRGELRRGGVAGQDENAHG